MRPRDSEAAVRWRAIVEEHGRSGLSVATFCEGRGLASSSFFAWKRRLGGLASAAGGLASGAGTGFVEARVVGFAPAVTEAVPPIELELLGGGRRVVVLRRGFDAGLLREVLMALEGERP